jgi:hypothetical protein
MMCSVVFGVVLSCSAVLRCALCFVLCCATRMLCFVLCCAIICVTLCCFVLCSTIKTASYVIVSTRAVDHYVAVCLSVNC